MLINVNIEEIKKRKSDYIVGDRLKSLTNIEKKYMTDKSNYTKLILGKDDNGQEISRSRLFIRIRKSQFFSCSPQSKKIFICDLKNFLCNFSHIIELNKDYICIKTIFIRRDKSSKIHFQISRFFIKFVLS